MSIKFRISPNDCDYCQNKLSTWDYIYKEKHYCRSCYEKLFLSRTCSSCNKTKRIYKYLEKPICKTCQVKDMPCSRCGKTEFRAGKILKDGIVCNSCIKYFVKLKTCSSCNKEKINVSNRNLLDGSKKLLCINCYNKTLLICSCCGYRRKAFSYDLEDKPKCQICSTQGQKECIKCNSLIPAGYGNICKECNSNKTLDKKMSFLSKALSANYSVVFKEFCFWLSKRRGSPFASLNIQHYYGYFFILDEISLELKRVPSYEEIVSRLTIAKTREYLLVTIFLDEIKLIEIDVKVKDEYANIDMIDKYLKTFKKESKNYMLISSYYQYLLEKLEDNKTTIRSIRLSITPAVKFLKYCENFKDNTPTNYILEGYLWCYGGQKAAITGFINFLQRNQGVNISIKEIKIVPFSSSSTSNEILKQRVLDMMSLIKIPENKIQYFIKILIGYLHNIEVPNNIFIDFNYIKNDKYGNNYILLNRHKLFIGATYINKKGILI